MAATLTTTEVAARIGVSAQAIRDWADDGRLPYIATPGGHRRFRPADVDVFIASMNREAAGDSAA